MSFKATNIVLSRAYDEIKREAVAVKRASESVRLAAAADIPASMILSLAGSLRSHRLNMQERASIPGITAHARTQEDDAAYDVSVEYVALRNGIDGVLLWVSANMPSNQGYLQTQTLEADGSLTQRIFTPAQTTGLVAELVALEALIS